MGEIQFVSTLTSVCHHHYSLKLIVSHWYLIGPFPFCLFFCLVQKIIIILTSHLLLQFSFVFCLPLFLSIAGSTPESQVIRCRVRSVAHPAGHRIITLNHLGLSYSCSVDKSLKMHFFLFFVLITHLVVMRAL